MNRVKRANTLSTPHVLELGDKLMVLTGADGITLNEACFKTLTRSAYVPESLLMLDAGEASNVGNSLRTKRVGGRHAIDLTTTAEEADAFALCFLTENSVPGDEVEFTAIGVGVNTSLLRAADSNGEALNAHVDGRGKDEVADSVQGSS